MGWNHQLDELFPLQYLFRLFGCSVPIFSRPYLGRSGNLDGHVVSGLQIFPQKKWSWKKNNINNMQQHATRRWKLKNDQIIRSYETKGNQTQGFVVRWKRCFFFQTLQGQILVNIPYCKSWRAEILFFCFKVWLWQVGWCACPKQVAFFQWHMFFLCFFLGVLNKKSTRMKFIGPWPWIWFIR